MVHAPAAFFVRDRLPELVAARGLEGMRAAWFGTPNLSEQVTMATEAQTLTKPVLLLTPQQTAPALAISPRKLFSMTASGEIPHIRIGRCVRYDLDDLRNWINEKKGDAPA